MSAQTPPVEHPSFFQCPYWYPIWLQNKELTEMIRVILCDDHAMIRRGIRETLSEAVDIQVTAEAGSYAEVREAMRTSACDVLVLDLNLPGRGGLEVLSSLREANSPIKVLIVSMYPEDQYAIRCLRAGAQGYLNKAGEPADLVTAVRTVAQGRKYVTCLLYTSD